MPERWRTSSAPSAAVLHPLAMLGCAAESVVGTGHEIEETPAIALWAGRVGPLAQVRLQATRLADDSWHFDGWPEHIGFEPTALLLVADPFTFPADGFLSLARGGRARAPGHRRVCLGRAWSRRDQTGGRGPGGDDGGDRRPRRGWRRHRTAGGPGGPGLRPTAHRHPFRPQRDLRGGGRAGHGVPGRPDQEQPRPGRHRRHRIERPAHGQAHRRARRRPRARSTT